MELVNGGSFINGPTPSSFNVFNRPGVVRAVLQTVERVGGVVIMEKEP